MSSKLRQVIFAPGTHGKYAHLLQRDAKGKAAVFFMKNFEMGNGYHQKNDEYAKHDGYQLNADAEKR